MKWYFHNISVEYQRNHDDGLLGRAASFYEQSRGEVLVTLEAYVPFDEAQELMRAYEERRPIDVSQYVRQSPAPPPGPTPLLEPPRKRSWQEVLGDGIHTQAHAKRRYKRLASKAHPDAGGRNEVMVELNQALAEALQELP